MNTGVESTIALYTKPAIFAWDDGSRMPYDELVGLEASGTMLGSEQTDVREIIVPDFIEQRLAETFRRYLGGERGECHDFLISLWIPEDNQEMRIEDIGELTPTDKIHAGEPAVIDEDGMAFVHSIGYGLGGESLQVLSTRGEMGVVDDEELLALYDYSPHYEISDLQLMRIQPHCLQQPPTAA